MSCFALDEERFRLCCRLLLQRSDQLRDGWSWNVVQGSEEGYLKKTVLRSDSELHATPTAEEQQREQSAAAPEGIRGHSEDDDDEDDGACTVLESSRQALQYEYHVLYSCSYNTPVLYFRAFTLEGRSLSLEEVWSSVHPNFRLRLQESPLDTITQQEHPLLGQPFFMLHPCKTEEFMKPLLQAAVDQNRPVNYVLSWLSVVGPVVGLHVPLQYCETG
ncbi:ubiquitin-like-conjugating enzyme ATG10 isoform X2 [Salarias fasciatus]|uniref:Ubiquitin-like-conjugating enzyme ATG10 n=2 Tax=Salarias fasciatus TaxID=181472 RepID=A0A672HRD1_SALFA|nr:ubiquitin-like-conjugating enzyme ATG10 isoform X2 [Salarias fasciatus]